MGSSPSLSYDPWIAASVTKGRSSLQFQPSSRDDTRLNNLLEGDASLNDLRRGDASLKDL